MSKTRSTIGGMISIIAIAAVDIAALRWLYEATTPEPLCLAGMIALPSLNLLAVGLVGIIRRLAREGECGPFSVGFQAFGWPTILLVVASCLAWLDDDGGWLSEYVEIVGGLFENILAATGARRWFEANPDFLPPAISAFFLVALGGPPLIAPALGGIVFRRLGVTLVYRSQTRGTPRTLALRRGRPAAAAAAQSQGTLGGPAR